MMKNSTQEVFIQWYQIHLVPQYFVRPFDDLSKKEQEELQAMRQASTTAETIYQLSSVSCMHFEAEKG